MARLTRSRSERRSRSWSRWTYLAPLVALWAVPAVAVLLLLPTVRAVDDVALRPASPGTARVGESDRATPQAAAVRVRIRAAPRVRAPGSGLVTQVAVRPGQTIRPGQRLMTVDGAGVYAYRAAGPLYRDLGEDDVGDDVVQLGHYLSSLGLLDRSAVASRYDWRYAAAVRSFEKDRGEVVDGTFHRVLAAWIPVAVSAIGSIEPRQGDSVSAGQIIAAGADLPRSATIGAADKGAPLTLPPGGAQLRAGSRMLLLPSLVPQGDDLTRAYAFLQRAVAAGSVSRTTAGAAETYQGALVSPARSQRVGTVPATAVYRVTDATCIFLVSGARYSVVRLDAAELIAGTIGSVGVPARYAGRIVASYPEALPAAARSRCR